MATSDALLAAIRFSLAGLGILTSASQVMATILAFSSACRTFNTSAVVSTGR